MRAHQKHPSMGYPWLTASLASRKKKKKNCDRKLQICFFFPRSSDKKRNDRKCTEESLHAVQRGSSPRAFVCVRKRKASSCQMAPQLKTCAFPQPKHREKTGKSRVTSRADRTSSSCVRCPPFTFSPRSPLHRDSLPTPSLPLLPITFFFTPTLTSTAGHVGCRYVA